MFRVFLLLVGVLLVSGEDSTLPVHKDVLRFILGCHRDTFQEEVAVPVFASDIHNSGATTSQHVSLLNLDELNHALRKTVNSDVVLGHIMEQVGDAMASSTNARSGCSVENHIKIDIPPGEVDEFHDKIQLISQQNNILLLQQINSLFTYKLRSQRQDLEKLVKRKANQIMNRLNLVLFALGVDLNGDNDGDDDSEESIEDTTEAAGEEVTTISPSSSEVDDDKQDTEFDPVCKCKKPKPANQTQALPVTEIPQPEPEPQPEEPQPAPVSTPQPEPLATSPVSITTFYPLIPTDSSEEEDDDDGTSDSSRPSSSSSREESNPGFERVAQKPAEIIPSNIGLVQPMIRRRTVQKVESTRPASPRRRYRLREGN